MSTAAGDHRNATESGLQERRRSDGVSILFVLGAVIASTLFLALHSTLIHRRTSRLTRETAQVIAPALHASQRLIVAVSLEREALLLHMLAADTAVRADQERHAQERAAAVAELLPLLERVGGDPLMHARRLVRIEEQWRAVRPALTEPIDAANADLRQEAADIYGEMLHVSTAIEESLRLDLELAWRRISESERLDWFYTLGQLAVAIAASAFIVRLLQRIRLLASEAEQRREEAVAALQDRTRLIRGITHDVKNPLGVADASAQLLELGIHGALQDAQRRDVERIRRGIGGALRIVRDLLDLSRAEAGNLQIDVAPTDLQELLRNAAEDYRAEAVAREIRFELRVAGEVPPIATDGARVRQILDNLLSNAFKFTPAGGSIEFGVRQENSRVDSQRWLSVYVVDDGPGIQPEDRERIFEEFYRSRREALRTEGYGVGLAISRRIARLLGGDLLVDSDPGEGTSFSLRLPADRPIMHSDAPAPPSMMRRVRGVRGYSGETT